MPQSKSQKKFEKNHLKDTLERRNNFKKTKQKHQLNAKKKARRAEENGRPEASKEGEVNARQDGVMKTKDAFHNMSVDEFFQGGFEVPDMPKAKGGKKGGSKRKRDEDEEDSDGSSSEQEPVPQFVDEEEDENSEDEEDHQGQLDALAQNDPEFHKYLKDNEPELLGGNLDEVEGLSEDEEEEEEGPKRKKAKKAARDEESEDEGMGGAGKNELTKATLQKWEVALKEQHSLRTAKEVVLAFRAAAHVSDDGQDQDFKYTVSNPQVYHQLLTLALTTIPEVFQHHVPIQENKTGKIRVPTESKKFKTVAPLLKSQIGSIQHLLSHLSDAATLRQTLSSTLPLIPYLLSFKKLVRDLAKSVSTIWSSASNTESTRVAAFLLLRRLTVIGDNGIRENVLKAAYQGLVSGSRNTTTHTLAGVNLMKNSASELWGLCADKGGVAYTTAFTFIRQLAIHLRSSIQKNSHASIKEAYKVVYNWQYVHSLDFWSRVLSSHASAPDSALRPLIYPLVQTTLGALRLIPTATYFPLRFHLLRSLLRLSRTTGTYIPLAAPLYEVLNSAEMRKAPKASTLRPLDFETTVRAPKGYLRTRVFQDGVGEVVVELLAEFLALWGRSVAFPELSLPVVVMLKRWLKDVKSRSPATVSGKSGGGGNRNQKVNTAVALLVQKVEANVKFVEEKRGKVEFAPNNRKQVESFLEEVAWEKTPVGAFVGTLRRQREERARALQEGRREEEGKRGKKGKGRRRESKSEDEQVGGDDSEGEDGDEED